jgi:O-antigen/teichoic acid export membrane protein
MQFDKIAIVYIANAIVSAVVTVGAAMLGGSYLSMAMGALAGALANVVILNCMRPGKIFVLPTLRGVGEIVRFGSLSSAASIVGEIGYSAPDLILGKTLGFSDVAFYSRANGLRQMATRQILVLVRGVYFPSFAQMLRSGGDAGEIYSRTMGYMTAITAPMLALLALLAEPLIVFLYGPQWERSASLASILCGFGILTTPTAMVPSSLIAAGEVALLLRCDLVIVSMRVLALSTSVWLELEHVVLLLAITYGLELVIYLRAMRRVFALRAAVLWQYLKTPCFLVLFTLVGPMLMFIIPVSRDQPPASIILLSGSLVAGLCGWLVGVFLLKHPLAGEVKRLTTRPTRRPRQ